MDSSWKIALGIGVIILYIYSILGYRGIYWPLRKKYEELTNRRSFQKKNAILSALMGTIAFIREVIFSGFINQTLYKISYWFLLFIIVLTFVNYLSFVKQIGLYK